MVTTLGPSTFALCSVPTKRFYSFVSPWKQTSRISELNWDATPIWSGWWSASNKGRRNSSSSSARLLSSKVAQRNSFRTTASNIAVQEVADHHPDLHNVCTKIHYYRYPGIALIGSVFLQFAFCILRIRFRILDFGLFGLCE